MGTILAQLASVLISLSVTLNQVEAQAKPLETTIQVTQEPEMDLVIQQIKKYAVLYNVSGTLAIDLAKKESQLSADAKNKRSSAKGIYQWIDSSWKTFCVGDVLNAEDNIKCSMKVIGKSRFGIQHWTADLSMREFLIEKKYVE